MATQIHKRIKGKIAKHTTKADPAVLHQTAEDARNAVLITSLTVNLFFLTGWLVFQVTDKYNDALIAYLQ